MLKHRNLYWKLGILLLVLVLIIPVLAACDDDDDDETTQPTATQPTATTAPTTPASTEPVKIGVMVAYTGQSAMTGVYVANRMTDTVKYLVEQQGGLLGGRPLEFVKCDTETQVAGGQACWNKLALQEKVSAIIYGGASTAVCSINAEMSDEFKVPVFTWCSEPGQCDGHPYVIHPDRDRNEWMKSDAEKLVAGLLGAKTVGIMADDDATTREQMGAVADVLEGLGVEVVLEQFIPYGTNDYSSYLTRIKRESPDVVIGHFAAIDVFLNVFRQMADLGGWGDTTFCSFTAASNSQDLIGLPSAVGSYHSATWLETLNDPGSVTMKEAYSAVIGEEIPNILARGYWVPMTAVEAIEQAGTDDPQAIAEYARSGDLAWEAPGGTLRILPEGDADPTTGFGHFVFKVVAPGETERIEY